MPENSSPKAFSKPVEYLDNCCLTTLKSSEAALKIAEMLSVSEPWLTLKFSANSLSNYLTREDAALHRFAITVDDILAGIICVRHPWLRGPYIELLGLFPDFRGSGIGKQVVAWAETEARCEAKNLWVIASSFNQPAIKFYQDFGFKQIGSIPGLVTTEHDEILLRKSW